MLLGVVGVTIAADAKPVVHIMAFFASIFISGVVGLRTAAPDDYARLLIAGRPSSEALAAISRSIGLLCAKFTIGTGNSFTSALHGLGPPPFTSIDPHVLEELKLQSKRCTKRIRSLRRREDRRIRRIEAMKRLASLELDIPVRRMRDHILQFSTQVFSEGVGRYIRRCEELDDLEISSDRERILRLIQDNSALERDCSFRAALQQEFLSQQPLHRHIKRLASSRSTSEALGLYAGALVDVAREHAKAFDSLTRHSSNAFRQRTIERHLQEIDSELTFLHRKQLAHPGIDLHRLLLQVVKRAQAAIVPPSLAHHLADQLTILSRIEQEETGPLAETTAGGDLLRRRLRALSRVGLLLQWTIERSRKKLSENVITLLDEWALNVPATLRWIVVSGYSRTVQELIVNLGEATATPRRFTGVFLLVHEDDELGARLMKIDLIPRFRNHALPMQIATGDLDLLEAVLDADEAVLLISGAECFDEQARAVHARTTPEHLTEVRNRFSSRPFLFLVVAEEYKQVPSLADAALYGSHYDPLHLFPDQLRPLIVSDKRVLPESGLLHLLPTVRTVRSEPPPEEPPAS